jgi:hypothetical protein
VVLVVLVAVVVLASVVRQRYGPRGQADTQPWSGAACICLVHLNKRAHRPRTPKLHICPGHLRSGNSRH